MRPRAQVVTWPVTFRLTCAGLNHAAPGATIELDLDSANVPLDGTAAATPTTIGPVPDTWTAVGEAAPPGPDPPLRRTERRDAHDADDARRTATSTA